MYFDEEAHLLKLAIENCEHELKKAKWDLFCYENHAVLFQNNLRQGVDLEMPLEVRVLIPQSPLEKCAFDQTRLKIVSPIYGGSDIKDNASYQCPKCRIYYRQQLTTQDQEDHSKRMSKMVFS